MSSASRVKQLEGEVKEVDRILENSITLIMQYEKQAKELKEENRLLREQIRVADVAFNAQLAELKETKAELTKLEEHFNQECPVCGSTELIKRFAEGRE